MGNKNIVITGGRGTLGKALRKLIPTAYCPSREHYDLVNEQDVKNLCGGLEYGKIYKNKPDVIVHAAARVGGIMDNINYPEDYFYDNIMMDTMMLKFALAQQSKGLQFIGILSTCAYPDVATNYPMTEDMLFDGPPAKTNFAYGFAKRAMAVHIDAANQQYDTKYQYLIPCNLYSGKSLQDKNKAHFLDALIEKIRHAKERGTGYIDLMGTGVAKRQFMLADDLARVIKMTIDQDVRESFNVCPNENLSIKDITNIALGACDAIELQVRWDNTGPDGQLNKQASNTKFKELFPDFRFTSLKDGIRQIYEKNKG